MKVRFKSQGNAKAMTPFDLIITTLIKKCNTIYNEIKKTNKIVKFFW